VRRRIELRAVLVGGQLIGGGDEAVLFIGKLVALLGVVAEIGAGDRPLEHGMAEARPHRLHRLEGMGQVDILRGLEAVRIEVPERVRLLRQGRPPRGQPDDRHGRQCPLHSHRFLPD
jgi:hypothetical protein